MRTKRRQSKIKKEGKLLRMMRVHTGIKAWSMTERKVILATVRKVNHVGIAAAILGISKTKLYAKLQSYRRKRSGPG